MILGSAMLSTPSGETFNDSSNQGVFRTHPRALAPDTSFSPPALQALRQKARSR